MLAFVLQAFLVYGISFALWRLLRQLIVQSSLDNIPGPSSRSLAKGNLGQIYSYEGFKFHTETVKRFGRIVKIHGLFGDKQLYVSDPLALHHIVVKDQHVFEETSMFIEGNRLLFGMGLLGTLGEHHRRQRKMLNPVFSINHMRHMIPMFYKITYELRDALTSRINKGQNELDVLFWMSRTALELIGQAGLGYSFESLGGEAANPYAVAVKRFQPVMSGLMIWRQFTPWIVKLGPPAFRRFLVNAVPWRALHDARDIIDVMHKTSAEVLETKKLALKRGEDAVLQQVGEGKDIMSILLRANMEASEEDRLSESELLGQMTTLIFAAFDTTSSALTRILHLLALHPEHQEKLRAEIIEARRSKGDLSYDDLVSLPYLEAVCRETLRLYAPVTSISRTTRKDTVLPLSKPIRGVDGSDMTSIPIPNNTNVFIGIMAVNRDPLIWGEDAEEWKPERWLKPLPESVGDAHIPGVYANMMTFLGGGRACIGFKFSQLEMKIVLSILVESFVFAPGEKEISWKLGGIMFPTVGREYKAQLPLKVSVVKAPASA